MNGHPDCGAAIGFAFDEAAVRQTTLLAILVFDELAYRGFAKGGGLIGRLEDDEEDQQGDDRGCIKDPARDEQVQLTGQQCGDAQSEDGERQPERARLTTPTKQKIDRSG